MSLKVLVYEHLTAGGVAEPVPVALADAGLAMWRAVMDDFTAAGCTVLTTEGSREYVGSDQVRIRPARDIISTVRDLASQCDIAIVIAPETAGVLERWIDQFQAWKVPLLNCASSAVALCADKFRTWQHLDAHGVPAVPTVAGEAGALIAGVEQSLRLTGGAYVIKPRDGAGCEATFVCQSADDAHLLRERVIEGRWIAQPFVAGRAVSVSFIANERELRPLLAGSQSIEGGGQLRYAGGTIPLSQEYADRAIRLATRAVETLEGVRGFIGVDLILGDRLRDDVVLEINPRITMSYCGLRALAETNLAALMLNVQGEPGWRPGTVTFDGAGRVMRGES